MLGHTSERVKEVWLGVKPSQLAATAMPCDPPETDV